MYDALEDRLAFADVSFRERHRVLPRTCAKLLLRRSTIEVSVSAMQGAISDHRTFNGAVRLRGSF